MPTSASAGSTAPATAELLRQVRRVELKTRRLVDSRFSGEYLSSFKGQGIEFAEVRPYQPGDEVRSIDWNVTARLREPFVKRYVEERELSVLFIVDLSASDRWGTRTRLKSQLVAEVVATLAMSAVRNNDRVAMLIATDRVESFTPPRKGRRHVLRLVRDLLVSEPISRGTDLSPALTYAQRVLAHRALVFLFSDFELGNRWDSFGKALVRLRARHDVVACRLTDPGDFDLPRVGLLRLVDPETGRRLVVNTSARTTRERYADLRTREQARARRLFTSAGVDEIVFRTDLPYTPPLMAFFRRRERRRGR
ncbi:MAG: DUF58 domain-containing protein [Gemmatimonas sp.]|nr:DUF58 domain-containing protein [Gemmatimonas sp.]